MNDRSPYKGGVSLTHLSIHCPTHWSLKNSIPGSKTSRCVFVSVNSITRKQFVRVRTSFAEIYAIFQPEPDDGARKSHRRTVCLTADRWKRLKSGEGPGRGCVARAGSRNHRDADDRGRGGDTEAVERRR